MKRMWHQAVLLVVLSVVGVSAAPTVTVASAQEASDLDESATLQQTAIEYYVRKHGVTHDGALDHLKVQDRVMPSLASIERVLGGRYGGGWFDPTDGGRLTVAIVDRDSEASARALAEAKDLLRSAGALTTTEFQDVEVSYDELVRASHEIANRFHSLGKGERGDVPTVGVDVRRNAVVLAKTADASAVAEERVGRVKQDADVPVRETTLPPDYEPQTRCLTTGPALSPFCDRPLRGGVEMGDSGACTAGFNATSRSDGKRYVMTAGHCAMYWWYTKTQVYGQWQYVGAAHNMLYYHAGKDAGIVRNEVPTYWQQSPFPSSTVWVDGIPGGNVTYDPSYHISNEANGVVGTVVCTTGGGGYFNGSRARFWEGTQWASYTWCGTVTLASDTVVYYGDPTQTVYNAVRTDLCFHGGMSGGPVYKNHLAYGIVSGDACDSGYQWGWYYPAILAENDLNVNIVH